MRANSSFGPEIHIARSIGIRRLVRKTAPEPLETARCSPDVYVCGDPAQTPARGRMLPGRFGKRQSEEYNSGLALLFDEIALPPCHARPPSSRWDFRYDRNVAWIEESCLIWPLP